MKIYEIDAAIEELLANGVDEETGEVTIDTDKLEALQMERDIKVENLICYYKNKLANVKAIKDEEDNLAKRRAKEARDAERAGRYIEYVLRGEKFHSAKADVSYRESQAVSVKDGDWGKWVAWARKNAPGYLKYSEPVPDKVALTKAIKDGTSIDGVELVSNRKIQIK